MKKLIACLTILLIVLNGYSKINVDSLKIELDKPQHDTTKVKILKRIAIGLRFKSPDEAIEYSYKLRDLSVKIGDNRTELFAINNIAISNGVKSDFSKCVEWSKKGLEQAEIYNDIRYQGDFLNNLGIAYMQQKIYDKAIESYEKSKLKYKEIGNYKRVKTCNKNLSIIYIRTGAYNKAININMSLLKYYESINDTKNLITVCSNLSSLYHSMKNLDMAIEYAQKCEKYAVGNDWALNLAYSNLAKFYIEKQNWERTIEYIEKSGELLEELNDPDSYSTNYYLYAKMYYVKGEFDLAEKAIIKSYETAKSNGILKAFSNYYMLLGEILFEQGNYYKGIEYLNEYLSLTKNIKSYNDDLEVYKTLSKLYENVGKYKKANEVMNKVVSLTDTLAKIESTKQINRLEAKYQSEKKAQQILLLEKDKELKISEINTKNIIIYSSFGGLALLILLFAIYRNRQKVKLELSRKSEILIKEEYNNLYQSHKIKSIKAAVSGQEEERQRISQELHDGVCSEITGVRMQLEAGLIDSDRAVAELNKIYDNTRRLSHDLVPPEFNDTSFEQLIKSMVEKNISEKQLDFVYEVDDSWLTEDFKFNSYRILQEAITNINKHSEATKINLVFRVKGNTVELIVSDNGSANKRSYEGNGIRNMKSRAEVIGGSLDIDNSDKGTVLTMTAPLSDK